MSLFGWASASPTGERFHSVQKVNNLETAADGFGPLTAADTEWQCLGSFVTETQVFYGTLPTGEVFAIQIIHSSVGLYWPSIQATFGLYDTSGTAKNRRVWKSVSVTGFTTPVPGMDKRSCKSDQISITLDPKQPDTYKIDAKYDKDVVVSLSVSRLPGVPGWKVGKGPRGGMSYFGTLKASPSASPKSPDAPDTAGSSDGFVIHRFWPRCTFKGTIVMSGRVIDVEEKSTRGMFVHAIQGMRPNLIASRWAFADFQSAPEDGVSLVSMQFTTPLAYGSKTVNIGSVVVDDKLVAVTFGDGSDPNGSGSGHEDAVLDPETGYQAPRRLNYRWHGGAIDGSGKVKASLVFDLKAESAAEGQYATRGLVEKIDVLGEIPALVKKIVHATGTQPYIYQWLNETEATIELPDGRTIKPKGRLFCEASYVSEP